MKINSIEDRQENGLVTKSPKLTLAWLHELQVTSLQGYTVTKVTKVTKLQKLHSEIMEMSDNSSMLTCANGNPTVAQEIKKCEWRKGRPRNFPVAEFFRTA